jgi:hypothetical protein
MRKHPSLSIVITNYNYGNYLAACIGSAIRQTRAALEIIVVDDGSTDGSEAVLGDFDGHIRVIGKSNGGQASAFNAGFAAARGDLIYFLDADDIARPELVETVTGLWHESLAAICFGLELIDAGGRHMGVYDILPHDIDNRQVFLNTASFDFLPTSGNVFARRVLERLMPMEEERWRICADAVLLRAAAIEGRIMPVRRTLAAYRIHPNNNYYIQGASDLWRDRRGLRDLSDLAEGFAGAPRYFGTADAAGKDERRQRDADAIVLLTSGIRSRAGRAANFDDAHATGRALRKLGRRIAGASLPLRARLGLPAALFAASILTERSAALRRWLTEPTLRPAALVWALDRLGYEDLSAFKRDTGVPRWRAPQLPGRTYDFTETTENLPILRDGWRMRSLPDFVSMVATRAHLSIWFNPSPGAHVVRLSVLFHHALRGTSLRLLVRLHDQVLVSAEIIGNCVIDVPLPERATALGGEVLLELEIERRSDRMGSDWLRRLKVPVPTIALESVTVERAETLWRSGYIEDGALRPFADLVDAGQAQGFVSLPSGMGELRQPSGQARLSFLATQAPFILSLHLPPGQPSGLMRISGNGREFYYGQWGVADRIEIDLPEITGVGNRRIALTFAFKPGDMLDMRRPMIAAIAFRQKRTEYHFGIQNGATITAPSVNPGQHFNFFHDSPSQSALAKGWDRDHEDMPVATEGTADLVLRLPGRGRPASAVLEITPILELMEGFKHVVGVSHDGHLLVQTLLEGPAEIDVPLADLTGRKQGAVELSLHSFLLADSEDSIRPGPIRLESIHFSGPAGKHPTPASFATSPITGEEHVLWAGSVEACLSAAITFIDNMPVWESEGSDGNTSAHTLLRFRSMLIAAISRLGDAGLNSVLANENTLRQISRLQSSIDMVCGDAGPVDSLDHWPGRSTEALKRALIALAGGPAWASVAFADLAGFPPQLLWHVPVLAGFLTRSPSHIPDPQDREAYATFVERLFASADECLARETKNAASHLLATEIIRGLQPRHLLFSKGTAVSTVATIGRAIERQLLQDNYPLAWLPAISKIPGPKLRVGVIMRAWEQAPEPRIIAGLLAAVDPRLQTVRVTLTTPDMALDSGNFDEIINLDGLDVGEAVDTIRAARLDILLLGSYFLGLDQLAAIVAHRLATVQLAMAAISPTSTGLSSFDGMLTSEELDPSSAPPGYCEPAIRIPGPVQRFGILGPDKRISMRADPLPAQDVRTEIRLLHDLPPDATIYVSGAMVQKIGSDLLDAFARILLEVDDAIIVLYPYAANWLTKFSPSAFRRIVETALASRNLPAERVRILAPLSRDAVTDLLASADVYLDSFPYAGATTVVEALEQRCPVVALEGGTQRARQGAAWVRHVGLEVASTVDGYVEQAIRLGKSPDIRAAARTRIEAYLADGPSHRGSSESARVFADRLLALAAEHGVYVASDVTPSVSCRGQSDNTRC